jgi:phosphoribosylanthranilate isomerase
VKRIRVKFCGITSSTDAEKAVSAGPDALGFVFFKDSPRYVEPERAEAIIKDLPPFVTSVGIFVNEDIRFIQDCVEKCGLGAVQIHGDETPEYCSIFRGLKLKGVKLIKGIRLKDQETIRSIEDCQADAVLLDAYKKDMYGGTGKVLDRSLAVLAKEYGKKLIISGGLNPDNVREIIEELRPYAVDVSSGIESSPGKKNTELMEEFMQEVRMAEHS